MSDGRITRLQWKGLIAAWLGWAFDGLDGYLYIMVAVPFVTILLTRHETGPDGILHAIAPSMEEVTLKAAIIQAFFLVGWALGGAVFGRIGDRLGRARTLTLTILIYASFTGLSFFAQAWWHLLIFRFIAALGIGGEWAAGSALVSETLHKRHRAWASATLQSGYMVGMILASLTAGWMKDLSPRWVFVVGVAPAFLTLWIRRAVPEPEEWRRSAEGDRIPSVWELFRPGLRRTTLLIMGLTSICLATVWGFLYFAPQALRGMDDVAGWSAADKAAMVSRITLAYILVNIAANYAATYLARAVGYRLAFAILLTGALLCFLIGFRSPVTLDSAMLIMCLTSFFALGVFGLFPLYIPPLFPTLVRTLGAGLTYNIGRLVAAAGTLAGGAIAAKANGPTNAIWWLGWLYVPGILIALLIPEIERETPAEARS